MTLYYETKNVERIIKTDKSIVTTRGTTVVVFYSSLFLRKLIQWKRYIHSETTFYCFQLHWS